MILERGNMWDIFGTTDIFMITTNPIKRSDGAVVMGRGIALEAKELFPELPYDFGKQLDKLHPEIDQSFVGEIGIYSGTPIYFFMVKDHWRNKASLDIIASSCYYLNYYLKHRFNWKNKRIDLNFPGIGNGGLSRHDVLHLIEDLPDNIHIWEYDNSR